MITVMQASQKALHRLSSNEPLPGLCGALGQSYKTVTDWASLYEPLRLGANETGEVLQSVGLIVLAMLVPRL